VSGRQAELDYMKQLQWCWMPWTVFQKSVVESVVSARTDVLLVHI